MSSDDREIIDEFVIESREHLADIQNQLLAIEAGGRDVDLSLVNEVFRAVHSIKGAAGFLGFSTLGQLAHELETVLNLVRNRELIPDSPVTDVMLKASDTLSGMIEDIDRSNEVDISEHVALLEKIVAKELAEDSPAAPEAADSSTSVPEAAAATRASKPSRCTSSAKSTKKSTRKSRPKAAPKSKRNAPAKGTRKKETAPQVGRQNESAAAPSPDAQTSTPPRAPASTTSAPETSIRVAVSVLDNLMNLAGELVLSRNQLLQAVSSTTSGNLDTVASRLDQVTSELQEAIMQARMQPVGTVFSKFPRVVRDLNNSLNKQCELKVEGSEVELDKSIIEAISDPLTHLIRNSMDHGVERPEERTAAGKPAKGSIVLRAFHQAGKVNISIRDDGRGIDAAKLRDKAVTRGVINPEQARDMSDREALRLIFRPAFSMAEKVSDVSGRGVGMDVVRTNIEKLGGTVGIETEVGAGTTINIKLPLTLAIIPSLVVWGGGRRFAIPQASISALVRVRCDEMAATIQHIKGAEVFRLRGQLIPLVRLNAALGIGADGAQGEAARESAEGMSPNTSDDESRRDARRAVSIIVVETGHLRYGLVVDGLDDSEEIVVKPLGRHMQDCPFLAGATILGDGAVAMILDVAGIAAHCRLAVSEEAAADVARGSGGQPGVEMQTSLLFTNDPSERFGIPMELIDRVERIRTEQIDSVGGQWVLQYRGSSLALLKLEDYIQARPAPEARKFYVAVFKVMNHEVGLIVPELIDIRRVSTNVDTLTFAEPGVVGSIEVDGVATRLLDLHQMVEKARPEWFKDRPSVGIADDDSKPRILLAEDSAFFRKQLTSFLEDDGYEVVACEDGQIAWDRLKHSGEHFDLLVTDLEMPNMNGFDLAKQIKNDPVVAGLPIIAVTSLAAEEDIRRGEAAGIDEYHVKLDRESLSATVARYVRGGTAAPVAGARTLERSSL